MRQLLATDNIPVHNRDLWTVTNINPATGDVSARRLGSDATVTLPADYVAEHVRLGYAATEPGNQSVTETISLSLVSPSTTARGLYMAATRGRDDNQILVITDTHDPAEARDILDGILHVDRHDTPAVTQRRDLAQQDRPTPAPERRCAIPEWFAEVREGTRIEWVTARDEHEHLSAERRRLNDRYDTATGRLDRAETACDPHDQARTAAERAVADARRQVANAQKRFDDSNIFARRTARTALDAAQDRLDLADGQLNVIDRSAITVNGERSRAIDDLRAARRELNHHDLTGLTGNAAAVREQLENTLDALDTWRHWADGHTITLADLGTALDTLDNLGTNPNSAAAQLHDLADHWTRRHGIDLAPYRTVAEPVIERDVPGIELDFGIDL